ncbi:MAG: hypothetical protein QME47_08025 [Candidatus Thermoplasmatota archaeon]|nr:hypothetical protein [Candidatus Thermoplasmatota archaeon]
MIECPKCNTMTRADVEHCPKCNVNIRDWLREEVEKEYEERKAKKEKMMAQLF